MTMTTTDQKTSVETKGSSDMNITARVKRLEETAQALVTLLKQEANAVKGVDMKVFGQLQTIKDQLYDIYRADIRALIDQKVALKDLPNPTKENLRKLERDLSEASTESLTALDRAGRSFGRLRDRIVHIAKETVIRKTSQYGANGTLNVRTNRVISTGVSERA